MAASLGMGGAASEPNRARRGLAFIPVLPIILGIIAIVFTGIWHHFSSKALQDTKVIAALISLAPPKAFSSVLPALLALTTAFVVVLVVCLWVLYAVRCRVVSRAAALRQRPAPAKPFVIATGLAHAATFGLTVWLMVMFAISMLWAGGGLIASKATMDGSTTLAVVDETLPRLIKTAMGIDPAKQGYLVHVGDRDVDIGTSSCSLFCFTLARAMLADNIDCKCDASLAATMMPPGNETHYISRHTCSQTPVMCAINARAFSLYRSHMVPAVGAIVLAMLCVLCLLCLLSGTYARALSELRRADISRCSSTDADMAVTDVDGGSPRKGSGVV